MRFSTATGWVGPLMLLPDTTEGGKATNLFHNVKFIQSCETQFHKYDGGIKKLEWTLNASSISPSESEPEPKIQSQCWISFCSFFQKPHHEIDGILPGFILARIEDNDLFQTLKFQLPFVVEPVQDFRLFSNREVLNTLRDIILEPDFSIEHSGKFSERKQYFRRYFSFSKNYLEPQLHASLSLFIWDDIIQLIAVHQLKPPNLDYLTRVSQAISLSEINPQPQSELTKFVFGKNAELCCEQALIYSETADWVKDWINLCKGANNKQSS